MSKVVGQDLSEFLVAAGVDPGLSRKMQRAHGFFMQTHAGQRWFGGIQATQWWSGPELHINLSEGKGIPVELEDYRPAKDLVVRVALPGKIQRFMRLGCAPCTQGMRNRAMVHYATVLGQERWMQGLQVKSPKRGEDELHMIVVDNKLPELLKAAEFPGVPVHVNLTRLKKDNVVVFGG